MTAAQLRQARQALGLSLTGMAKVLDVPRRSYIRWETGTHAVPATVAVLVRLLCRCGPARRSLGL